MLIDARAVLGRTEFRCDLCIVGAGPAGIAIADRLRESGLAVILVESGGFEPDLVTQRLYRGENIGHSYYRLDSCRFRYFGGSTNRWGGWCRPLDPEDFERQDWLPWSGWPISEEEIRPFYHDVAALLDLPSPEFDLSSWESRLGPPLPLDGSSFRNVIFQYKRTNFGETYRSRLIEARNITLMLHANLVGMDLKPSSDRIDFLRIATLTKRQLRIHPRAVVLAAGGIENVRILLASRLDRSSGIGNEQDVVGRYFMEHLHVGAGHIVAKYDLGHGSFYQRRRYEGGAKVGGMIVPSRAALKSHKLLTTSIALESASYSVGPSRMNSPSIISNEINKVYQRASSGRFRVAARVVRKSLVSFANVSRRYRTWQKSSHARALARSEAAYKRVYSLYFRAAQAPDPSSRITLSDRVDELGVPEARLDWRVKTGDVESIRSWMTILDQDLIARDLGRVVVPHGDWPSEIAGGPHHIGGTRMSADPKNGVVDAHCRVHSVSNLYIAGSSVFATGGYANPTFTIIALALRLAETLKRRL